MAITILTGSSQAAGVNYSYRTSGSADWTSVPTASYFYDQTDQQVRYKDASSNIIEMFSVSASIASTASYLNTLNQDLTFNGNLTLNGTASIAYLNVVYETASVIYSSGSNQFGDAVNDTQTLIGTVRISGSANITGSLNAPSITGSLFGTASFATTASFLNSTTNAFIQGGNSFGSTALLGTNDTRDLNFETNGTGRIFISGSDGAVGIGTAARIDSRLGILETAKSYTVYANNGTANGTAVFGFAQAGSGTMVGVLGQSSATGATNNIGLDGSAGSGTNNYAIRLQDGTEGIGKVLVSQTADGKANWSTRLTGNYEITGSLIVSAGITGSLLGTASFATSASRAVSASRSDSALSASFATTSATASYVLNSVSASFSNTASYINPLNQNVTITGSLTLSGSAATSLTVQKTSTFNGTASFTSDVQLQGTQYYDAILVTTTDATQTDVWSYAMPTGTADTIEVTVLGVSSSLSSPDAVGGNLVGVARCQGGLASIVGQSTSSFDSFSSPPAFGLRRQTATNNIHFWVRGLASTEIDWSVAVRKL